jgi:hypothetical protein
MSPHNADHWRRLQPIIDAFTKGKVIEHLDFTHVGGEEDGKQTWHPYTAYEFNDAPENYRIRPDPVVPVLPPGFLNNPDAVAWARVFVEHVVWKPDIATSEPTMIGWFANAMQAALGADADKNARVQFENEDQLPATFMQSYKFCDVFGAMHRASQLGADGKGGVRVYPYVEIKGQRYYLVKLEPK